MNKFLSGVLVFLLVLVVCFAVYGLAQALFWPEEGHVCPDPDPAITERLDAIDRRLGDQTLIMAGALMDDPVDQSLREWAEGRGWIAPLPNPDWEGGK